MRGIAGDRPETRALTPMLFMIIERFRDGDVLPIYKRVRDQGRLLPDGLTYVDSWVEANFARCFQLMETDDPALIGVWTGRWRDLVEFEVIPVVRSAEAAARAAT